MINEIKTPDIPALPATTQKEVKTAFVIIKDWARLVSLELNKRVNNTVTLFYSILYPKNNQALVYDESSGYWKNKYVDHTWLQGILQADDTSTSTVGGKHVTDAMVKKYEDHRLITNGNPHGTNWDQLEETSTTIPFNTASSNPSYGEGKLFYDHTDHSLAYYNDASNVTVNLGREMLVRVYNNTGSDLVDGQVVYINGASSGWPTVSLAKADTELTSQTTLGMVTSPIANGTYGYICENGIVHGLDTHTYTAGQQVYLSATTAGAITATAPIQPNYEVVVGTVVVADSTVGQIFVHISKKNWHPSLELVDSSASITLPTTATVFKPATMTTIYNDGFTYDTTNGIITINNSSPYSFSITFNAVPPSANKKIYFYAEVKLSGGSWTPITYSGKQLELPNAVETQVLVTASKYFPVNSQLRFYIWASDTGTTIQTTYLDGLTTVYKPAFRLQMA